MVCVTKLCFIIIASFFISFIVLFSNTAAYSRPNLEIAVIRSGDCSKRVQDHYTVKLNLKVYTNDGQELFTSFDPDHPYLYNMGSKVFGEALDAGMANACIKEERKITADITWVEDANGFKMPVKPLRHDTKFIYEVVILDSFKMDIPKNLFQMIDTNQDTYLSRQEVSNHILAHSGEMQSSDHKLGVEEIFQNEDRDKDGLISYEEFSGPKHDEL